MDLFEKLFQKISEREIFTKKTSPGLVRLQNIAKYLDVFANSVVLGSVQVQTIASRDFVGLYGSRLFLPDKIDFFADPALNRNLYQNLILQKSVSGPMLQFRKTILYLIQAVPWERVLVHCW